MSDDASTRLQAARQAFQAAIKGATDEARRTISPGDRVSRTRCGGRRSIFTFTHWDGDWLCGRSTSDCAAASIYAVNGRPASFGCAGLIECARAELIDAVNAERASRGSA